ncbi:MAG: CPBP family intramembrane metalloprotease [Clostridiales Family XIII bacterium]|jgi:membrane protease YdiL (CAAX protease family)|nr:CPBP family intramembrane metalloprotease [Clostridiales Family XIII bacterium]
MNNFDAPNLNVEYFDPVRYRKDVRKDIRFLVLFMVAYFAVNTTAAGTIAAVGMFLDPSFLGSIISAVANSSGDPLAVLDSVTAAESAMQAAMSSSITIVATMVGAIAGALMLMIPRGKRFFTDIALPSEKKWSPSVIFILIMSMFALQEILTLLIAGIDALISAGPGGFGGKSISSSYDNLMAGFVSPLGAVYVVLIGPVFEELVFRGAILGQLRKYGTNFAILMSALFFGFFHMVPVQIPTGFLIGLLLGYAAIRYSLRMSIILHMINNGVGMIQMSFGAGSFVTQTLNIVILLCGIAAVALLIARNKAFSEIVHSCKNPVAGTNVWGVTTELFLLFMAVCLAIGIFVTSSPLLS